MNAMVDIYTKNDAKRVFEKDMLFATLETSVRQIKLLDKKRFTLSDTVGFVSELPHDLVKAFRATLDEVKNADLLLHVIDYSNENHKRQIEVTMDTLKEIGADQIPMLLVYNKVDLSKIEPPEAEKVAVYISAKKKLGFEMLIDKIKAFVFTDYVTCKMEIPYDDGKLFSYLNDYAYIMETTYSESGTLLTLECSASDLKKFEQYVIER